MLDSLHIKNFRCFEDLTIPSLGRVNLIVGKNNSGKSTLLETVYLYAKAASPDAIKELVDRRGDSDVADTGLNTIFHDNSEPKSYKERLEVGEISRKNTLIITATDDESRKEIDALIDGLRIPILDDLNPIREPDNSMFLEHSPSKSLKISNLRQGKLIQEENIVFYSPTYIENENKLADMWDQVFLNIDDSALKEALQIIESDIVNMGFIPVGKKESKSPEKQRIAVVKLKGVAKAIPIKRLGDGMSRLLQIFLYALQAKSGFLLLDEFENGLHYSIQEEVWEKLFKLAKELDVQVFATTHSEDAIKAFCKVAIADKEVDGKLISLARSAKTSNKGQIFSITYGEDKLETFIEMGMEVRG
ncbi:ATP-binding protein [Candidatus Thiothrix sp. Deng01]|uniref:ATP-binding protein n=1 Tax=Candidatus Thiothrix phosphatis TaxID=3112415 RepID=A0ABU6D1E4_9GAMM|nr:ATP-binding protein [Candidatus Thiothrix sp. Deng01]MEB4592903.1 ATP-binding protein [Candidatus Thiothrix sp. Deng01]